MSELKTTAKRNDINILYSIGVILAVFGHSRPNAGFGYEGSILNQIVIFIYNFHMPLFFVIAGILLFNSKSLENKNFMVFVKDKAVKLLTPYFVLTALFLIPKGFIEFKSFEFLSFEFIVKSFFSPRNNTWGHFWFLPVLFICYLILGGLKKLCFKLGDKFVPVFMLLCFCSSMVLFAKPINTEWFGLKDVSTNLYYMVWGMLIAFIEKSANIKLNKILKVIFGLVLVAVASFEFVSPGNDPRIKIQMPIVMIIGLLFLAKALANFFQNGFNFISKNIFTIYIYSWIFQSFTLIVLTKLKVGLWTLNLTMFVVGMLAPLVIAFIYKKIKKLNCKFFDLCLGVR